VSARHVAASVRARLLTLVATNKGDLWFSNISAEEREALQTIAQDLLSRTGEELDAEVEDGSLQEICHDDQD